MALDPSRIIVLVMAGGGGTRFWPRSRQARPKQFLSFHEDGISLLGQTVARLDGFVSRDRVVVITGTGHEDIAASEAGIPRENVVGEPCGRNTAPCIGLGTLLARQMREDAVVVVLAADHLIAPVEEFQVSVLRAAELAADTDSLVTMGLRPDRPATGYGYIQIGDRIDDQSPPAHRVVRFREKPALDVARQLSVDGAHLWNSGNLAFRSQVMLSALEEHVPRVHRALLSMANPRDPAELARAYADMETISIDHGVLEKASDRLVVEATFAWDDLGTFEAVARHAVEQGDGNLARGDALFVDSKGSFVDNDADGIVVVSGLDDVLVVRTADAVLVIPRDRSEDVKEIVKELKSRGLEEHL